MRRALNGIGLSDNPESGCGGWICSDTRDAPFHAGDPSPANWRGVAVQNAVAVTITHPGMDEVGAHKIISDVGLLREKLVFAESTS
jgi:hypothetical protein